MGTPRKLILTAPASG